MTLEEEAEEITRLLAGKTVKRAWRHKITEIALEFEDGTRLFVDRTNDGIEISIT
ncbi:MAG TPA: hypothetical protein VG387_01810 [Rhizomicrobium sp.]|jgi:hypothetical protein|nr:hypothetical protein [Rhizomicrobium sp.]